MQYLDQEVKYSKWIIIDIWGASFLRHKVNGNLQHWESDKDLDKWEDQPKSNVLALEKPLCVIFAFLNCWRFYKFYNKIDGSDKKCLLSTTAPSILVSRSWSNTEKGWSRRLRRGYCRIMWGCALQINGAYASILLPSEKYVSG